MNHRELLNWKNKTQLKWTTYFEDELYKENIVKSYKKYDKKWNEFVWDFATCMLHDFRNIKELNEAYKKYYDKEEKSEIELEDDFFYEFIWKEMDELMPHAEIFFEDNRHE